MSANERLREKVKKVLEDAIPADVYNYRKLGTKTVRVSENTMWGAITASVDVPIFKLKDAIEMLGDLT